MWKSKYTHRMVSHHLAEITSFTQLPISFWHWPSNILTISSYTSPSLMFVDVLSWTTCFKSQHNISMGFKPMLWLGQSITLPFYNFIVYLLVCFRLLLCWNIHFWFNFNYSLKRWHYILIKHTLIWCRIYNWFYDCNLFRPWNSKET